MAKCKGEAEMTHILESWKPLIVKERRYKDIIYNNRKLYNMLGGIC